MRPVRRWLRMRDALLNIGTDCTNFTAPPFCRHPASGRSKSARYGADRWCDGCIAWDGLYG